MFCIKEYRSTKGFTLIELMIVIAIIALLVSLAVPVHSGYRIRAKVTECIDNSAPVRFAISEYRHTFGEWPPSPEATGEANTGNSHYCHIISNYQSSNGTFTIDVNESAIDSNLVNVSPNLVPTISHGNVISRDCQTGATELDEIAYLPSSCRDS